MTEIQQTAGDSRLPLANKLLRRSAASWFVTAAIGQWIFLAYVITAYGGSAVQGDFAEWNKYMSGAFKPGETIGNLSAVAHIVLAVVILGGGPLQLIPWIRSRFPAFHRWTGRCYLVAVVSTAIVGLYMLASRDIGELPLTLGFILQGILIAGFATMTLRNALARNIAVHRRWALRLFMVASAVWFFRIILMIWVLFTGGIGIDFATGKGPVLDVMAFGQYLPLVILEIYFRVQDKAAARGRFAMAALLFFAAIVTVLGVAMATLGMWFPQE